MVMCAMLMGQRDLIQSKYNCLCKRQSQLANSRLERLSKFLGAHRSWSEGGELESILTTQLRSFSAGDGRSCNWRNWDTISILAEKQCSLLIWDREEKDEIPHCYCFDFLQDTYELCISTLFTLPNHLPYKISFPNCQLLPKVTCNILFFDGIRVWTQGLGCSTHWTMPPALFALVIFQIRSSTDAQVGMDHNPPTTSSSSA
jgi:hypothetical protein